MEKAKGAGLSGSGETSAFCLLCERCRCPTRARTWTFLNQNQACCRLHHRTISQRATCRLGVQMYSWKYSAQVFGEKKLKKNCPAVGCKSAWRTFRSDFHGLSGFHKLWSGGGQRKRYGWKNGAPAVILRPENLHNFIINTTKWPIPAKSPRSSAPSLT